MEKQSSTNIVMNNIYSFYGQENSKLKSLRAIAKYINDPNISLNILKNWSSGRSSPSLQQLELLGYYMSIHPSKLVTNEVVFSVGDNMIWKDNIVNVFYSNFERFDRQKTIFSKYYKEELMTYRSYRECLLRRKNSINLNKIDKIAEILGITTADLLEVDNEKKINSQKSIEVITNALQNIENHIPNEMRKTYSFKGRKSPEIISKILEALTKTNDIIFDPFIGSGTSIIGSHLAKRHLIGTELDPFTFAIDKVLFEKINKVELEHNIKLIEDDVKSYILSLYETECCGETNYIKKVLFDPQNGKDGYLYPVENREIKNGKNVKLLDKCSICGASDKHFTEEDWLNIQEQMKMSTDGFPTDRLIENSRINITRSTGADRYDIFFPTEINLLY